MGKRRKGGIWPLLLFWLGLGVILVPLAGGIWQDYISSRAADTYRREIENLGAEEEEKELLKARAYNEALRKDVGTNDPFRTEWEGMGEAYEIVLNLKGDGIMGVIRIPKIEVYLPIYHGTDEEILSKGAGHLPQSSLPVGGSSTHTVISAHSGYPGLKLFDDLEELREGDLFYLHTLGEELTYRVTEIETVKPYETDSLGIAEGKDYATLMTCTPYGINTHRLLVHGERLPDREEEELSAREMPEEAGGGWRYAAGALAFLLITSLVAVTIRRKRRKKHERGKGRCRGHRTVDLGHDPMARRHPGIGTGAGYHDPDRGRK